MDSIIRSLHCQLLPFNKLSPISDRLRPQDSDLEMELSQVERL